MLPVLIVLPKRIDNYLQMFRVIQKIGIGYIDEQGFYIVLFDVLRVCFLESKQIARVDCLFIGPVTFFYISR